VRSLELVCALAGVLTWSVGCYAPTLSKPQGKTHLDALADAQRHQHHGRLPQAADSYGRAADAAERRVDRDEARYRESRARARMGDYPGAIAICDELGASPTIARRTLRARLDAARYRLMLGEIARAEHDLRALIVAEPESAAARSALRILVRSQVDANDDKAQALGYLRDLRRDVERSGLGEVLMNLEAALLIGLERKQEARALLERQVTRYPYPGGRRWDDALWQLADLALEESDPRAAIAYLKQMIAVHERSWIIGSYTRPLFSKAALRIARIYRDELADAEAAIDAYATLRSEFPRSLVRDDAFLEEAELRIARGQRARGCDLLAELLEAHEVGSARRRAEARIATTCQ
jgi:tetratricopeptide (TPR) repeat protein